MGIIRKKVRELTGKKEKIKMLSGIRKTNSSYGNYVIDIQGKYTNEFKFFWNKKSAEKFFNENKI